MKITAQQGKVFRRISDGFIFGDEINLGIDYSTGEPREDLEEYYEQVDEDIADTTVYKETPNQSGYKIAIPEYWEMLFPKDKFIVSDYKIELERINDVLVVDVAYLQWQSFREELLKPQHSALARQMGAVMQYLENQALANNFI
jgi:hypothetical protein